MENTKKHAPKSVIPKKQSDHDERDETLAIDKPWFDGQGPVDEAMESERHSKKFKQDGVPLTDEDWEKEEENDDKLPDHIDKVVDDSLEALAEKEMSEGEDEE